MTVLHISCINPLNNNSGGAQAINYLIKATFPYCIPYIAVKEHNNKYWSIYKIIKNKDKSYEQVTYSLLGKYLNKSFIEKLNEIKISIGVVHCFQKGRIIYEYFKYFNGPLVAYYHDVSLLYGSRRIINEDYSNKSLVYFKNRITKEIESGRAYDAAIAVSKYQQSFIAPFFQNKKTFICPFPIYSYAKSKTDKRSTGEYLFIGGASHYPNYHAIESITDDLINIINKKNKVFLLHVAGEWDNDSIENIYERLPNNRNSIKFHGIVTNLEELSSGKIGFVPISLGSGVRVKILTMLSMGIPVIASEVATENIPLDSSNGLFIYKGLKELVDYMSLLENQLKYKKACNSALTGINKYYNPDKIGAEFIKILEGIC